MRLHVDFYEPEWQLGLGLEASVAQDVAAFLRRYDEQQDSIWSITQDQRIFGSIIIDGSIEGEKNEARLRYFIMSNALRGKGWGRRLMQVAIDFCDHHPFDRVYLKTFAGLDAACHLYEAFGFVKHHEAWEDNLKELYYERFLPSQ